MTSRIEYTELFWDCPECKHTQISAVYNQQGNRCPSCFTYRKSSVAFYVSPTSRIITDPAIINRAPFWVCKVCGVDNPDNRQPAHLLQCASCDSFQVSAVGGITGDEVKDAAGPTRRAIGEKVLSRFSSQNGAIGFGKLLGWVNWSTAKTLGIVGLAVGAIGGGVWLVTPHPMTLRVTSLTWQSSASLQEFRPVEREAWDHNVPTGAVILSSETRQSGTHQEQTGTRTVMVDERYQSGTTTRTESYSESERYQSGSREECSTTSMGNGVGQRSCRSVPTYSTRSVPRTRTVTEPVYSTRRVPRTEPVYVTIPDFDTWVRYQAEEWATAQTYTVNGVDDEPRRAPEVPLGGSQYQQKVSATTYTCVVAGVDVVDQPQSYTLPCSEYDLLEPGDTARLMLSSDGVTLAE